MRERQLPALRINLDAILNNVRELCSFCKQNRITVAGSLKFCDGNSAVAEAFRNGGCKQLAVSKVVHLKKLKSLFPEIPILFTQSPMKQELGDVVRYADIIMLSSPETLFALDQTVARNDGRQDVILMMQDDSVAELVKLTKIAKKLTNLWVKGIGIQRNGFHDNESVKCTMTALSTGVQAVEEVLGRKLEIVSAGHSLDILLHLEDTELPDEVNHLFIGSSIGNPGWLLSKLQKQSLDLRNDAVQLVTEIIENHVRNETSRGTVNLNRHQRSVLAIGRQDIGNANSIESVTADLTILACDDDRMVVNISDMERTLRFGDLIVFRLDFTGMLHAFSGRNMAIEYCYDGESAILRKINK